MRGVVIFLMLALAVSFFSFAAFSMNNKQAEVKQASQKSHFTVFTSAVCENKNGMVYCKDNIFVNCNGNISAAVDVAECDGMKIGLPKTTGSAVFGSYWKDIRKSGGNN